jgi:hypothetical protein
MRFAGGYVLLLLLIVPSLCRPMAGQGAAAQTAHQTGDRNAPQAVGYGSPLQASESRSDSELTLAPAFGTDALAPLFHKVRRQPSRAWRRWPG